MKRRTPGGACVEPATLTITALLLAVPVAARADCAPVLAAYAKAEATKRYAIYEVDRVDGAPKGPPIVVTIGADDYTQRYDHRSPLDVVPAGFAKGAHMPNRESDALQARERSGGAHCEPVGERKVGTTTTIGYRIHRHRGDDPLAIDLLVDRATGLPFVHGMGLENGGFRWVYGSAVVAPPVRAAGG